MNIKILPEVNAIKNDIIANRRDFHKHPELGFKENRTAKVIAEKLKSYGIEVRYGIGKTGVIGDLHGKNGGKTIALRADMDALPIQETGHLSFKSQNEGIMHACGHDGHMAMLLGAAKILSQNRDSLSANIRFIFQPAEEGEGGARYMIADGCLENVDEIYGMHLWNYQPYGEIGVKSGNIMAATDIFDITIKGIGGHGAAPQGTVDAIVAASNLIMSFQTIVSRNTDPLQSTVVTVGKIEGGHSFNVIADEVKLSGTVRAKTEGNRLMVKTRMQEIIAGVAKLTGAKIEMDYQDGYPPTINDENATQVVQKVAHKIVGDSVVEPYLTMVAEDFSYYLQKIPGCFLFIGSAPSDKELMSVPHHCSHFDFDERALLVGTSVFVQLIFDRLN
ncbi:M20 family metallopeptidase [Candidatus Neomarinimicrobiota bacterium]